MMKNQKPGPCFAAMFLVTAAGCLAEPAPLPPAGAEAQTCWLDEHPVEQACLHVFDPTPGRDGEVNVAAHPRDPDVALVTWREGGYPDGRRIFAAVTADAGATWRISHLSDPGITPNDGQYKDAFDSIAAFGPDGTAYVLFGGENVYDRTTPIERGENTDRMTLAVSNDLGGLWAYRRVSQTFSPLFIHDFMDLAVAPDSGHLHVVAQGFTSEPTYLTCAALCGVGRGVFLWSSTDGGATWSKPPEISQFDHQYVPRVAAGPGGLVVVTAMYSWTEGWGKTVTISRDGGKTFEPPRMVHKVPGEYHDFVLQGDPLGIGVTGDGKTVLGLVVDEAPGSLAAYRSEDEGRTWKRLPATSTLDPSTRLAWTTAAVDSEAGVAALYRYGSTDPDVFGMAFVRWEKQGDAHHASLALGQAPGLWAPGDDYGGLAYAADGEAWVSWSDPRGSAEPRAVATKAAV